MEKLDLTSKSRWVRQQVLEMTARAGKAHLGGAFSCADILAALYYGGILKVNPADPQAEDRDRFILSKGHSCESLYVILADLGFFPFSEIEHYQQNGYLLGGHPDRKIPGIEADTGSLGHGLGIGVGLALSAKLDQKDFMTVVLMGDGECCEGSVWEAAMFASCHELDQLIGIVDKNNLIVTDRVKDCMAIDPLAHKWEASGWDVVSIDGHGLEDLTRTFQTFSSRRGTKRPLAVIAHTVKGKGVSFMENNPDWHHGVPKGDQLAQARRELGMER